MRLARAGRTLVRATRRELRLGWLQEVLPSEGRSRSSLIETGSGVGREFLGEREEEEREGGREEKNEENEKEKGERERERKKSFGFVRIFKTRFYTSLDFSERNFIFAYFLSCLRFLTNTTLK